MNNKLTKQGTQIYKLIQDSSGHMTADQIHSELKTNDVKIGIATVYRNLNSLYEQKLINRVRHPEMGFIYDKNLHEHYHFHCVHCDCIMDVMLKHQNRLHKHVEEELEAVVISHEITFEGICKDCLALQED